MDKTNDEKKYCVYRHVFPNGKVYIGQTHLKPEKRWGNNGSGYLLVKKNGEYHQPLIAHAIQKYGWKNVQHEILFNNLNKLDALRIEQICICLFRSNDNRFGYNITSGGEFLKHSVESKKKMSQSAKKRLSNPENHPFFGKKHTKDSKEKVSASRTGKCVGGENPIAKKVLCVELNKIWSSCTEASNDTGIAAPSIASACRNINTMSGGYHWIYVKDYSVEKIKNLLIKKNRNTDVPIMCIETGVIYDNIAIASKMIGVSQSSVVRCVHSNGQKNICGHHFKIAEEEWLSYRSQLADEIISNLLRNEDLMDEVNKFRSGK